MKRWLTGAAAPDCSEVEKLLAGLDRPHAARTDPGPPDAEGNLEPTGIVPLDERIGGLRRGGVYLLAGMPGVGHLASVLQFLHEGVQKGETAALLTALEPSEVFEAARHWGLALEGPWRQNRLRLIGYSPDFVKRVQHVADPREYFDEIGALLGGTVTRLGIHPAAILWETRSSTLVGQRFLEWTRAAGVVVWATLLRELGEGLPPSTDSVLQGAAGIFELQQSESGVAQLWIRTLSPPADVPGPITVSLKPGQGIVAATGHARRRRTDPPPGSDRRLLLIRLAPKPSDDLALWARHEYELEEVGEPLALLPRLQEGLSCGVVLIHVNRANINRAILTCRAARSATTSPIIVVSDDALRAADRTRALQAGADDCLTGPLHLPELESRIRRARSVIRDGARPGAETPFGNRPARDGAPEPLAAERFAAGVGDCLASADPAFFVLVLVRGAATASERFRATLLAHIRWEMGDFTGKLGDGFGILLRDARLGQGGSFCARLRRALELAGITPSGLDFDVWSSPRDAARIRGLIRA